MEAIAFVVKMEKELQNVKFLKGLSEDDVQKPTFRDILKNLASVRVEVLKRVMSNEKSQEDYHIVEQPEEEAKKDKPTE